MSQELLNRRNIVFLGHVDNGKSTLIGRLLFETNLIDPKAVERIEKTCQKQGRSFEFAYLLDALVEEQKNGITIDLARAFFKVGNQEYLLIDAPGHFEFLKKMLSGATKAEAAVLMIDAERGLDLTAECHAYLLSLLGLRKVIVCINKMDLVDYHEAVFLNISSEYMKLTSRLGIKTENIIPLSALKGENVIRESSTMDWYRGPSFIETLENLRFAKRSFEDDFRMYVQDVYSSFEQDGERQVVETIVGTISSGSVSVGDEIIINPSGCVRKVAKLFRASSDDNHTAYCGESIGLRIASSKDEIIRGNLLSKNGESVPIVKSTLKANIFWVHKEPISLGMKYVIRVGTEKVLANLIEIKEVLDLQNFKSIESSSNVCENHIAVCTFELENKIAFDSADRIGSSANFAILFDSLIAGGGIILG